MSASDKKRLRREQSAEMLTQKQKQAKAEEKKLKTYTIVFVVAMALILCIALTTLVVRTVRRSGILERSSVAVEIGDTKLNAAELTYYYMDAINNMRNQLSSSYGNSYVDSYFSMMGLDTKKPLSEQTQSEGKTWADYFADIAIDNARSDIALSQKAADEGFTLPAESRTSVDTEIQNLKSYATLLGYGSAEDYLKAIYGNGAQIKSYQAYLERSTLAQAFYQAHLDGLSYDDGDLRAHDQEHPEHFNSYSYASCYVSYSKFLTGGTKDENGSVTYSDAEKEEARNKMEDMAKKLAAATSVEELKTMVEEANKNDLPEGQTLSVSEYTDQLYTSANATIGKYLAEDGRKEGDIAALPVESQAASTDEDKEDDSEAEKVIDAYYVVVYLGVNDNTKPMSNVRHLLVKFEGGTTNQTTGQVTYSDEEKAAAKAEAEKYLQQWRDGEATEESFIALVKEHSDDSSAQDGGLFEDINPASNYVTAFRNWAIDKSRKPGDAEVIETEYGYHVMYYVSDDEVNYRDYMITQELKAEDQESWYNGITEPLSATRKSLKRLPLDYVISG